MSRFTYLLMMCTVTVATSCVSTTAIQQQLVPHADLQVTDLQKKQLIAQWAQTSSAEKTKLFPKLISKEYGFVQPKNKKEKCLVPRLFAPASSYTDSDVIYWHGACTQNYATDEGRIILQTADGIIEVILDLAPNGDIRSEFFYWLRNYQTNTTEMGFQFSDGEREYSVESIDNQADQFALTYSLRKLIADGLYDITVARSTKRGQIGSMSYITPLYSYRKTFNYDPTVPLESSYETFDKDGNYLGVTGFAYKNERMLLVYQGQPVRVPMTYYAHFKEHIGMISEYSPKAKEKADIAYNMFNNYIFNTCKFHKAIDNIPEHLYRQICDYEMLFRDKVAELNILLDKRQEERSNLSYQEQIHQENEAEKLPTSAGFTPRKAPSASSCYKFGMGMTSCATY